MKTFTIDPSNTITAHASDAWAGDGVVKFQMEQELAALAATWPGSRLVEIWNKLKGVTPVAKFKDRKTAVSRIWNAIHQIEPMSASPRKPKVASAKKGSPNQRTSGESKTDHVLAGGKPGHAARQSVRRNARLMRAPKSPREKVMEERLKGLLAS